MEGYSVGGAVERGKEWNALNVVPVKVGHQEMDGEFGCGECANQVDPKIPQTGTTIDDQDGAIRQTHLDARRVAAETENLILRRGYGTAHTPKLQLETKWVADSNSPPTGHSPCSCGHAETCSLYHACGCLAAPPALWSNEKYR